MTIEEFAKQKVEDLYKVKYNPDVDVMRAIHDAVVSGYNYAFIELENNRISALTSEEAEIDTAFAMVYNHYIMPNPKFFQWIYERLVHVYNENPNEHYMLSLKERIEDMQKSSDKVEPKFKVGDWVVKKSGDPFEDNSKFARINMIDKEKHWFDCGTWLEDKDIRLWSINDAKDGDVLVHNECIFIFMGLKDGIVQAINDFFPKPTNFGDPDIDDDYHPATKEQWNALRSKMKEAGYEWDSDNKKVITIK